FGCSAVQHAGDVRVLHQRERLTLRLETGHHCAGVHPELDDLQRDAATHRGFLLSAIYCAESSFADAFAQNVLVNARAGTLAVRRLWLIEKTAGSRLGPQ